MLCGRSHGKLFAVCNKIKLMLCIIVVLVGYDKYYVKMQGIKIWNNAILEIDSLIAAERLKSCGHKYVYYLLEYIFISWMVTALQTICYPCIE